MRGSQAVAVALVLVAVVTLMRVPRRYKDSTALQVVPHYSEGGRDEPLSDGRATAAGATPPAPTVSMSPTVGAPPPSAAPTVQQASYSRVPQTSTRQSTAAKSPSPPPPTVTVVGLPHIPQSPLPTTLMPTTPPPIPAIVVGPTPLAEPMGRRGRRLPQTTFPPIRPIPPIVYPPQPNECPPLPLKRGAVVAIGDSHTMEFPEHGYKKRHYVPSYARSVANKLGYQNVHIIALGGQTAEPMARAVVRLAESIESNSTDPHLFDFCLIMAGSNDVQFLEDTAVSMRNIERIHHECLRIATTSVVALVPPRNCGLDPMRQERWDALNAALEAFSMRARGCHALNATAAVPATHNELWQDCMHMNYAGRSFLIDAFVRQLQPRVRH